jgi:HSP20 family protein
MAIGYDPFRELEQMTQQLLSRGRAPRSFPMDAYRRGDEFRIHLDLPGVDPDSIDVIVEGHGLSATAERRFEQWEDDQIIVSERPQGRLGRELRVGASIDAENIGGGTTRRARGVLGAARDRSSGAAGGPARGK